MVASSRFRLLGIHRISWQQTMALWNSVLSTPGG